MEELKQLSTLFDVFLVYQSLLYFQSINLCCRNQGELELVNLILGSTKWLAKNSVSNQRKQFSWMILDSMQRSAYSNTNFNLRNLKAAQKLGMKTIKVSDPLKALRELEELIGISFNLPA